MPGIDVGQNAPAEALKIERLAETLYVKKEHLDPTDAPPWACIDDHERELYRTCVESRSWRSSSSYAAPRHDQVRGGLHEREQADVDRH